MKNFIKEKLRTGDNSLIIVGATFQIVFVYMSLQSFDWQGGSTSTSIGLTLSVYLALGGWIMMVVGTWRYYSRDELRPAGLSLRGLGTRLTEILVLSIPLINIPFAGVYIYYHYKLSRRILKAKTETKEKVRQHLERGDGYVERERYSIAKKEYEKCMKSIEELEISSPDYLLTTAPRIRNFAIKNELKQELADDLSEAEGKKEKAERMDIEYEETLSNIKKAEGILDSIESNLEQDKKSKAIEDVDELHSIINNLPEDISPYEATQEIREIKNRCDNLITKI
jgi:hypothetical protein